MPARSGVKPANQRRRKRSFYSRALDESERLELDAAREVEGLDEEIAVLRVKLQELIREQPDRLDLCVKAAGAIAGLVRARYHITRDQKKGLKEAITKVLTEIAIPAGVSVTKAILK